ncbi:UNVERIFIED_CONTAM: hypothetical protein RMT77_014561 [Armadillidium vulgare]
MDAKFKIEIKDEPMESFDDEALNNLVFVQVSGLEERIDYSSINIKGELDIKDDPLDTEEKNSSNENQERKDYSSIEIKEEIDIKDEPLDTEERNSPNENQEINIKNELEIKDEPFDDEMEGRSNDQVFGKVSRLDQSQNLIYNADERVKDSKMKSLFRSRPQTSGIHDQNIQENHVMSPKRALWSENDLVSAVQAVERGLLSTYKAAERYKVPRRTIRNHLQTGSLKKTLGRKSILSDDQETELVNRIMRFSEVPVTSLIVRRLVFKFCELNNIKHNFNPSAKVAGNDWFKAFMKRHPEISRRKAQFMNPARAQKLHKFIVDDHFKRLSEVYDNLDLKSHPERIYNMDEKGCCLTIHHQQTVLAKKRAKRVHLQSSEHAESVTIAGCVNAHGIAIPPMIIFKGRQLKQELYDNLPPGTLVQKSRKGYMTNELFKDFLKHLAQYKSSGKCLLIFNGAACHLDLSIVEVADSLDIALYCLPSNTTHELQPLDKAVYRSFEHHWDSEVLTFMEQNPNKKLTKARFNSILSNVWSKSMTHNNIISGFRATGLYPLNPQAIPETSVAPSLLTEAPAPPVSDDVNKVNSPPLFSPRSPTSRIEEEGIGQTPNKRPGSFYRRVYCSSSSDDDEDHVPLAEIKRTVFKQLMPTPVKNTEKTPIVRRKALNYRGNNKDVESQR